MKLKLIAAAVAFAAAGSVHAVDIVVSGATASGNTQRAKIISDLCGGTAISYRVPAANDFWAVNCNLTAPASLLGQNYTFYKAGLGSGFGVSPVDTATPLRVVDLSTCALNDDLATPTVTEYDCAVPTTNFELVPQIGFSDVEPAAFRGTLAPPAAAGGAYDGSGLISAPVFGLVFGVIISENLRDTLQAAQGLAVGSELEIDMPSLSAQAIRSLQAGRLNTWSSVAVDDNGIEGITEYRQDIAGIGIGLAGGTADSITTYNVGPALTDTRMHICRRAPGSGTLAQYAMIYHGTNCTPGAAPVATPNGYAPAVVPIRMVSAPQGSGDMEKCVSTLATGVADPYSVPEGQVFGAPARVGYAIGQQSLERNATLTKAYRFVKVDGEAPTCANVHAGRYFNFAESTLNRRDDAPANVVAIFDELANNAFSADTNFACSFPHPFGFSGLMGIPNAANTPAATWTDSTNAADNSVNAFTRLGNTCQYPVIAPQAPSMLVN